MNDNKIGILGIINLICSGIAGCFYILWALSSPSDAFRIGILAILAAAILMLITSILTLKNKGFGWGCAGIAIFVILGIYVFVVFLFLAWV